MATPKDITIDDLEMGILYIHPIDEGEILVQRNYRYVGADPLLATLGDQVLTRNLVFATLPQSVKDWLIGIDGWTYSEALSDEGMT